MPVSDAQKRASRKWEQKNRERKTYLSNRATAKSFIRRKATEEDLEELRGLIDERLASIE